MAAGYEKFKVLHNPCFPSRYGILKKRNLWMSALAALVVASALAGCGSTTYFAGRTLPPSGLSNRVLITVQNPTSPYTSLMFVDAYYDTRAKYNSDNPSTPAYTVSGFSETIPWSIQSMPEEQIGAIYSSSSTSSGSLTLFNYATEQVSTTLSGLISSATSSVFITRDKLYAFATSQGSSVLSVIDRSSGTAITYSLSLPAVGKAISVNPGGTVALVFVQNSNYIYYPRKLTAGETTAYSGGYTTWPEAAVDCEPKSAPGWCLFQAQSPDSEDTTGNYYGSALTFDRPAKAIFSADGGTAYVLSCGPECGGTTSSVSSLSVAPLIFRTGQNSGKLPTQSTLDTNTLAILGGASNALINSSTMYVVGQELMSDGYWGGHLTVVTLPTGTTTSMSAGSPIAISDGTAGARSRMILADDDTLWIGMSGCTSGERANNLASYDYSEGCLTMFNTSTNTVTKLESTTGDATGIAAVTDLHKVYAVVGGNVYIYSTLTGAAKNNQYVTVTGTAYDVAYMDADSDSNNTDY
jgi:hypothetical protein